MCLCLMFSVCLCCRVHFSVCEELHLQTITIHRSVNYLDRLLSKRTDISRAAYQLLATACIFVAGLFLLILCTLSWPPETSVTNLLRDSYCECAAKFEEQPNNVPTLCQLMSQSEGLHSKTRLIEAEKLVRISFHQAVTMTVASLYVKVLIITSFGSC